MKMKNVKKVLALILICVFVTAVFTACHSHKVGDNWKIDKDSHWRECECGEISEKGEHIFELDICTVCSAERKTEDGIITDLGILNSYGDQTQTLSFDKEGNLTSDIYTEYTYDDNGNKLTDKIYKDGAFVSSGEYECDSKGFSFKKYETEYYEDSTKCTYEFNETGDIIGYIIYDADGNKLESYYSEYLTDENGDLIGEKVYENDVLKQEIKYAAASNEEEDFLYAEEVAEYSDDGSKFVEKYDENGDTIQEIFYNADGEKEYAYDLEYFYDEEGNLTVIEKREDGELKQEVVCEYDDESNFVAEKTYEGDKLIRENLYTQMENYAYESKVIIYNDDGTTTVYEYDENGETIE